jgi:hypothetical protein
MKAVRLALLFGVSIWMSGGCLLGCGSTAMAAHGAQKDENTITATPSCHSKHHSKQPTGVPAFMPGPRESMKDCPLAVGATAAISKSSNQLPHPGSGSIAGLPVIETRTVQLVSFSLKPIPPNRGPTYLRCCVLLI